MGISWAIISLCCLAGRPAHDTGWVVAKDGTGNYTTVQAALDAVPAGNQKPLTIFIRKGVYREKLHLDSLKDHVTLAGEDKFGTVLVYDDHTGKIAPSGDSINTRTSYSMRVAANDFCARGLTFANDAGFSAGQAVALEVRGDRASFYDCRMTGNQDVLFLSSATTREFYQNCYIEGTTDFIFGAGTAWFEDCHIHTKKNSHVTAASTPADHPYGFVFYDCMVTGDTAVTEATLGRPWRPYAAVDFIHCYIDKAIRPEGWSNWNKTDNYKTARYAEYENYGPGAGTEKRVGWMRQLSKEAVISINRKTVLGGWEP